ncbi:hypothetical protein ES703_108791 [subsurface metagenome]
MGIAAIIPIFCSASVLPEFFVLADFLWNDLWLRFLPYLFSISYSLIPAFKINNIKDPIANAVNNEYEILNKNGRNRSHRSFHKKSANTKNSGKTLVEQKIGIIAAIPIIIHVVFETFVSSSHLFFLKVVNLHAIEAKIRIEIIGVIIGRIKINNM